MVNAYSDPAVERGNKLSRLTEWLLEEKGNRYSLCCVVADLLAEESAENLAKYLGSLPTANKYKKIVDDIYTALLLSQKTRKLLATVVEGKTTARLTGAMQYEYRSVEAKINRNTASRWGESYETLLILNAIYNHEEEAAILAILGSHYNNALFSEILLQMLNNATDEDWESYLYEACHETLVLSRNSYGTVIFLMADKERMLRLFEEPDVCVSANEVIIEAMPPERLARIVIDGKVDKKYFIRVLNRMEGCLASQPETTAEMLAVMADHHNSAATEKRIFKEAAALPQSAYLLLYLSNGEIWMGIKTERSSSGPNAPIDAEALYRYFTPFYELHEEKNEPVLTFSLRLGKYEILRAEEKSGVLALRRSSMGEELGPSIAYAVREKIQEVYGDEIALRMAEVKNEIAERLYKENVEKLTRVIHDFSVDADDFGIQLADNTLADIDFYFSNRNIHHYYYSGSRREKFSLEMKIGQTKKYVVRDAKQLIRMFDSGETTQYGKGFEFTHDLGNIVESTRPALELLMLCESAFPQLSGSDRRYLYMDEKIFSELLMALKGRDLYFNGQKYTAAMNELSCRVRMDKKYTLRFSAQGHSGTLIRASGNLFLFDSDSDGEVNQIVGTPSQKMLYNFAYENNGVCMEPVLEKFCDEVYSRFYSDIEVVDSVRDRLKVSELAINAYFDFARNAITVRTELMREEKKLQPKALKLKADRIRYGNYLAYLSRLGFENGILNDDAGVLTFFSMDMTALKKHCNVYLSEELQNKKLQKFNRQIIRIRCDSGIMQAFLDDSEYSDKELKAVLDAIRKKKKYILLSGDRILDLNSEAAAEFENAVSDMGLNREALSQRQEISVAQALKAFAHESSCRIDEYLQNMVNDIRTFKTAKFSIPAVHATLRPYQEEGFRWLKTLSSYHVGGILADDMGLGKTLEIITLFKSDDEARPSLVVCPKSLVFNWKNEFSRFDPDTEVIEIYGNLTARKELIRQIVPDKKVVYITSYDSLRNDLESYEVDFNYLVLDEAQYIKNVKAQKSISVKSLKAAHKFALTGTPIENSVMDLWSIFDFILPGYFEELSVFKSSYTREESFTARIARRIAPFVLRRTKRDVLKDLPDKYERVLAVEMTKEQRKIYDAYRMEARSAMEEGAKAFEILPYLMRLRQICDDPGLFIENCEAGSGKLDALYDLLDEYLDNGHRMLVYSQFKKCLEQIKLALGRRGVPFYEITGDTPAKERIRLMNDFNAGTFANVFLISLKAGGTGLNLTGADTVIHIDPWWNAAAEDQASDRAHRIGQTKNVEVIKLICEDSVEQRVIELQNIKKDIIDSLISNSDTSVTGVTLEDISFILE